jgi:hypothetical protein
MPIREMKPADYAGVQQVRVENGLVAQSPEGWRHFLANPHGPSNVALPIGWVLENGDGRVVGLHGAYPVRYIWRGRTLTAFVAHSLAVNQKYRHETLALLMPYFKQSGVDFLLTSSANESSARLFQFMQAKRMPVESFGRMLSWVVNYRAVVKAELRKKGRAWAAPFGAPLAACVRLVDTIRGRNQFGRRSTLAHRLNSFDERFDRFWRCLSERTPRLLAMRDRESLQWHFEFAMQKDRVRILALEQSGRMSGYVILLREVRKPEQLLDRYHIVDLQVLDTVADAIEGLMAAALDLACEEGVAMVEAVGFDQPKRQILDALRPYARASEHWPFWYKEAQSIEGLDFTSSDVWDPTMLDGDATIWNEGGAS